MAFAHLVASVPGINDRIRAVYAYGQPIVGTAPTMVHSPLFCLFYGNF